MSSHASGESTVSRACPLCAYGADARVRNPRFDPLPTKFSKILPTTSRATRYVPSTRRLDCADPYNAADRLRRRLLDRATLFDR